MKIEFELLNENRILIELDDFILVMDKNKNAKNRNSTHRLMAIQTEAAPLFYQKEREGDQQEVPAKSSNTYVLFVGNQYECIDVWDGIKSAIIRDDLIFTIGGEL